jgi:hypothetical protein
MLSQVKRVFLSGFRFHAGSIPVMLPKKQETRQWQTSSPTPHGGHFIRIVEWAREGTHVEEVDQFLTEQRARCEQAEQANPILKNRRRKEKQAEKAARRAAKKSTGM